MDVYADSQIAFGLQDVTFVTLSAGLGLAQGC